MGMLSKHPDPSSGRRTKSVPDSETDVNQIVDRFTRTGQLPPPTREGQFADVSDIPDLRACLEKVTALKLTYEKAVSDYRSAEKKAVDAAVEASKKPIVPPVEKEEKKEVK